MKRKRFTEEQIIGIQRERQESDQAGRGLGRTHHQPRKQNPGI
jgi:hypothetical protein